MLSIGFKNSVSINENAQMKYLLGTQKLFPQPSHINNSFFKFSFRALEIWWIHLAEIRTDILNIRCRCIYYVFKVKNHHGFKENILLNLEVMFWRSGIIKDEQQNTNFIYKHNQVHLRNV